VKVLRLGDLPVHIQLSDQDSMLPTRTLSATSDVSVSAHISLSGDASRASGDWVGYATVDTDGSAGHYTVSIDQLIE
jgi:hypothetical protein